jgi:hypothetical protein
MADDAKYSSSVLQTPGAHELNPLLLRHPETGTTLPRPHKSAFAAALLNSLVNQSFA